MTKSINLKLLLEQRYFVTKHKSKPKPQTKDPQCNA